MNRLILVLSMLASAWLAVRMGQDVSFDVKNYHFYSGFAFLHKPPQYDFAPAQKQSFLNPLLHVFSYLMLDHLPSKVVAAMLGAVQGLNFFLVFRISGALLCRWTSPYRQLLSLGNAAAGFYAAANISELGTTFGDNLVSLLTLTGLLLVFRTLPSNSAGQRIALVPLWIAGASIGVGCGLKPTVVIHAVAITLSLAAVLPPLGRRARPLAAFCGGLTAGFIAAYGSWGTSLYLHYRNPFFPFMNNIFRSPYYDAESAMDARFLPRSRQQTLFYPFFFARKNHLVSELDFRDVRLAVCYVAVVLLAGFSLHRLVWRRRTVPEKSEVRHDNMVLLFVTIFFVVSYGIWQYLFSIYRYLIVLELLAPTFLALALAYIVRKNVLTLALSLVLNLAMCSAVLPMDWGRQKFDDEFLKVRIPAVEGLDKSVVLMAGDEPTSYIIPQFPAGTRFLRVLSNFIQPGKNPNLDRRILDLLAQYQSTRTLVYVATLSEMDFTRRAVSFYGLKLDDRSCLPLNSRAGDRGYLCRIVGGPKAEGEIKATAPGDRPLFERLEHVGLEATPAEARVGKDTLCYRIVGLNTRVVDMLYTLDGELMPPIRNWRFDAQQSVCLFVDAGTRKGLYHIIGIRGSSAEGPNKWVHADVRVRIK